MFTPLASLAGGLLIGLAASLLLVAQGCVAGISGVLGGALRPARGDLGWRLWFLGGLVGTGALLARLWPAAFPAALPAPAALLVGAGLLVGFGTRVSGGCTSGHGVCGLGRASPPSLVAVVTFMASGALSVFVLRHLLGVAS